MVISVVLDGVPYKADDSYNISLLAGSVGSASVVAIIPAGGIVPRSFMSCQILADGVPLFWGIIDDVSSPAWSSGKEIAKYALSASSGECLFNNRLVSESYSGLYTHQIIAAIFDSYIAAEGLTLGQIDESTQYYNTYTCSYTQLSQVLSELADDIGYTFYVSPDKKFYFISRTSFASMDAPEHITNVKLEEENGDIRSKQIVTGATEETSSQTEGCYWLASQSVITLGYQVSAITGVTIAGTPVGVGILGVDDDDVTKTFLYTKGGTQITLNPSATTKPTTGQNVVCVYKGYYDIVVENENSALISEINALNGTSGIIEKILTDTTIKTYADADTKSQSLLNQYGEREQTVTADAHSLSDTALYTMWMFALTDQRISGQYVIVERNIKAFGVDSVWISVKLKNKGFFSRYGTSLVSKPKTAGSDSKIYKTASLQENITATDDIDFESAGLTFNPSDGSLFIDPCFDDFYPI